MLALYQLLCFIPRSQWPFLPEEALCSYFCCLTIVSDDSPDDATLFPSLLTGVDVLTTCICSKSLQSGLALRPYGLWLTHQAPLSIGLSSQEYRSEFPCSPPEGLPNPENKRKSSAAPELQVDSLPLSHLGSPFS